MIKCPECGSLLSFDKFTGMYVCESCKECFDEEDLTKG